MKSERGARPTVFTAPGPSRNFSERSAGFELALQDEKRLAHVRHDLRRIVLEDAREFRIVHLFADRGRELLPALAGDDGFMNALLKLDFRLLLLGRKGRSIEQVLLLRQDQG